jgi:hypothetical protein
MVIFGIVSILIAVALCAVAIRHVQAESTSSDPMVLKRLDEIAVGQQAILAKLDSIAANLKVIQARVTQ